MRRYSVLSVVLGGLALLLTAGAALSQEAKLPDGLRPVPPDALGFVYFRVGDFLKGEIGKALFRELQQDREARKGLATIEQVLGIDLGDVESVTLLMLPPMELPGRPLDVPVIPFDLMPRPPVHQKELDFFRKPQRFEEKKGAAVLQDRWLSDHLTLLQGPARFEEVAHDDPGPLVIVTSIRPLDRKRIMKSRLSVEPPGGAGGPSPRLPLLFLSDQSVMMGPPSQLVRYTELLARKQEPRNQPMKPALALGTGRHVIVAGGALPPPLRPLVARGYVPPELRRSMAVDFLQPILQLAGGLPLLHTDAALALDLENDLNLILLLQAPTEASATLALQAVKTIRALAQTALDESRPPAKTPEWQRELHKALPKALADSRIEQQGTTVRAEMKMELSPEVYKQFTAAIVETFRRRGDRARSSDDLKQIGLAIHSYYDAYRRLPPAAISSIKNRDGKPLLSWRVAILPFIEQAALYREFDLDQPWDHPNNKKLITRMPAQYTLPGTDLTKGLTHYRALVGPDTMFETIKGADGMLQARHRLHTIVDGTSNTIMVVEARDPTIWTRPDDLPYDPKGPLPRFGTTPGGFLALMGDGSVRFVRSTVSEQTLRNAITCSDGNVLGPDWDQ
jgi:hypothetical protein